MKIRTKVSRWAHFFFKVCRLFKKLYHRKRRRPAMVAILYATTFGAKKIIRQVSWARMRLALKLINHSLGLNWGYAPVASFDKSLFYQNLFYTLRKKSRLPTTNLSPTKDPRNLSSKWLVFRTPLTPLASTEKKTLSGFDIRLADLKGPTRLKAGRLRGLFSYSEVSFSKVSALGGVNPLAPFIGQGRGWGVRSSRANYYLRNNPFSGFKKPTLSGFFGVVFLPKATVTRHRQTILAEEALATGTLLSDGALLICMDVSQGGSLLAGGGSSSGKAESPNVVPQTQSPYPDYTILSKEWNEYAFWATGVSPGSGLCFSVGFVIFSKRQAASKVVASYV